MRRLHAAHCLDHLFADFHWRWERFRVVAERVRKVNVKQIALICHKQIVEMAVANAKQICDYTVAGAALDVRVHDSSINSHCVVSTDTGN